MTISRRYFACAAVSPLSEHPLRTHIGLDPETNTAC